MEAFFEALFKDSATCEVRSCFAKKSSALVYGMGNSQKHAVFAAGWRGNKKPLVIIVPGKEQVNEWREELLGLLPNTQVLELPELDSVQVQAKAHSMELSARRMDVLGRLARREAVVVLAEAGAAVQKGLSRHSFDRLSLRVSLGDVLPRETFLERLVQLGYEHVPEVEHMGQFSIRGSIADVFSINSVLPIRIEFFDDEVDTIREFDLETKLSIQNVEHITVLPVAGLEEGKTESFLSYLDGEGTVLFDEPMRIREQIHKLAKENPDAKKSMLRWEELLGSAEKGNVLYAAGLLQKVHGAEPKQVIRVTAASMLPFRGQMELLENEISRWLSQKQKILLLMPNRQKADSMRELLARKKVPASFLPEGEKLSEAFVNVQLGNLSNGFEFPEAKLVVLTEADIFGHAKRQKGLPKRASAGNRMSHFQDIKPGDYVVHIDHGIGKYLGVETLVVDGIHRDYFHIKYGGEDKLFVPTEQVRRLQKYVGAEGEVPRLHQLGGTAWVKAKAKAKRSVEDIAGKLIEIYARRKNAEGFSFSEDDSTQRDFEDAFPYVETEDQLKAIEEIKRDMEQKKPMDRLLCGDVGFGKTEVAIRAAYKAAMDGKQVAVLVPTTVLAQQHFQTFSERFMNFLPRVDVICRFRTAKEQKETLRRLKEGQVDILIGTHAILNQKKVVFKDLGLLIVDEEQRFGVKQKEKIKAMAAGLDVLTLSATPIPRTLHMSLVGARDMSIIETPPAERFPVQTYVVEYNEAIMANAIKRELKRGGQVYFVYNRVETIDRMREHLEQLVPEARIMTAHGQMSEELLERVMLDFYEGEYDLLLATSIVENGLDVPNANTIIVYDADNFGLSQLYQMRGRVGRSSRLAFAWFVYREDKILSETAEKRLQTMKEFAQLGAGFKIAMRDLEIRGAGNLLGSQQHGHIASVGFEMYCKLLEEAVEALQEKKDKKPPVPEPRIDLQVEAYIDGGYIDDAMHKLELYQRIAAIRSNEEIRQLLDELIDRFGEPSQHVMNLLSVARLKNYGRDIGVKTIEEKAGTLDVVLQESPKFSVKGMVRLQDIFGINLKMIPTQRILRFRLFPQHKKNILGFVTRILMMLSGDEEAFQPRKVKKEK